MWEYLVRSISPKKNQPESSDIHPAAPVNQTEKSRTVNSENEAETETADNNKVHDRTGRPIKRPKTLTCPVCRDYMQREKLVSVEIDRCNNCGGIFLDKGELQEISGYDLQIKGKQREPQSLIYTPHGLSNHVKHGNDLEPFS